jgi:hypothetical protein
VEAVAVDSRRERNIVAMVKVQAENAKIKICGRYGQYNLVIYHAGTCQDIKADRTISLSL